MRSVLLHILRIRQRWRAALRAGSLILLLAFLPSFGYLGHWGEFIDHAAGRANAEEPLNAEHMMHHAAHCHGNSSCSEQMQPYDVSVIPEVVELPQVALIDRAVEDDIFTMSEIVLTPPTEPPRL